jgi:gamma-polyglutamate synthase
MNTRRNIRRILENELSDFQIKLENHHIDRLITRFFQWPERNRVATAFDQAEKADLLHLYDFIKLEVILQRDRLLELHRLNTDFNQRIAKTNTIRDRQQTILEFSAALGATKREQKKDQRAFSRWMDTDAILDRFAKTRGETETYVVFCMNSLRTLAAAVLTAAQTPDEAKQSWDSFEVDNWNQPFWQYDGDARVRVAAFHSLAAHLKALPHHLQGQIVNQQTMQFVYRAALQTSQQVWVQCEALSLLVYLSPDALLTVLRKRLEKPKEGDDLFVRGHAVKIIAENIASMPAMEELFPLILHDPSPFVRQQAIEALHQASREIIGTYYPKFMETDKSPQVRSSAALGCAILIQRAEVAHLAITLLNQLCRAESDELVLRTGVHAITNIAEILHTLPLDTQHSFRQTACACLDFLHSNADSLAVRRWASMGLEKIHVAADDKARALYNRLEPILRSIQPGTSKRLPRKWLAGYSNNDIGRVLAILAQDDFGYQLHRGWLFTKITRGFVFRFRFWRMLYELWHPSPDKRQAFSHTIGRVASGSIQIPSAILSELSETKVIGEPLFIPAEQGWRPYLPLVDDFLSCLGFNRHPVHFYSHEGVTIVRQPRNPLRRLWAFLSITVSFRRYAAKRNWQEDQPGSPHHYIQSFRELGYHIHIQPHENPAQPPTPIDPKIERFFAMGLPFADWQNTWTRFQNYIVSVYENSLIELGVFVVALFSLFIGQHWWNYHRLQKARQSIPLVIGGWGTRGKSGTERLKAAVFNACGHSVFSKTTGCEAMFMFGYPFGALQEIFLYRSYDKATIWEQRDVVQLAAKLQTHTFLWECMGLTPSYVNILQKHWMKDHLSTITNSYPDHEDIQGPAGINIPEVMTCFIPKNATLLTSEEQMKPILRHASQSFNSTFRSVGWLEAGLLTDDILSRFPYNEHPYNIALVLALAQEIGIDRNFALKEMADRVIPDLGVLKVYPASTVYGRKLQFANGMSANERHGCLSNWIRLGFHLQDPQNEPDTWITTVVNNRADRLPRSQVFASILVHDLSADKHYLIGSNLKGLMGFIRNEWEDYKSTITLNPNRMASGASPLEILHTYAKKFRVPCTKDALKQSLRCMMKDIEETPPSPIMENALLDPTDLYRFLSQNNENNTAQAIQQHFEPLRSAYTEYQSFLQKITDATEFDETVDNQFRDFLERFFFAKFIVVDDYYASGNKITQIIAQSTPPNFFNRIMGIQNIKGTGLDFVYLWQSWDRCHDACRLSQTKDPVKILEGLRILANLKDFSLLSETGLREHLHTLQQAPSMQRDDVQALIQLIRSNLKTQMQKTYASLSETGQKKENVLLQTIGSVFETLMDGFDAIRRRRITSQIYRDLTHQRISLQRAALELKNINTRQKGGWFTLHYSKKQKSVSA